MCFLYFLRERFLNTRNVRRIYRIFSFSVYMFSLYPQITLYQNRMECYGKHVWSIFLDHENGEIFSEKFAHAKPPLPPYHHRGCVLPQTFSLPVPLCSPLMGQGSGYNIICHFAFLRFRFHCNPFFLPDGPKKTTQEIFCMWATKRPSWKNICGFGVFCSICAIFAWGGATPK